MSDKPAPVLSEGKLLELKSQAEILCKDIINNRHITITDAVLQIGNRIHDGIKEESWASYEAKFKLYFDAAIKILLGPANLSE